MVDKVDKSLKYYDEENFYPKSEYIRDDKTKTKIFGIRLSEEEIKAWKQLKLSKTIHEILSGEEPSRPNKDTKILKKMIPEFVEKELKVNLEEHEVERIKQLWSEVNNG